MTTFVSLLRGINVGGHKKIKMADLRAMYEGLGFSEVQSYIQSGNVVFEAPGGKVEALGDRIEAAIQAEFGFEVPVMIRTAEELRGAVDRCPFVAIDVEQDGAKVLVTFLSGEPAEAGVDWLQSMAVRPDRLVVVGREIYWHCPGGFGNSKLSMTALERKLGMSATGRNWKTVLRLVEMVDGAAD